MILRERSRVNATAEQVWAILCDPSLMSLWNPHCVRCAAGEPALRIGLRFHAVMRLSRGPERELECEVVECQPQQRLTLRFTGQIPPQGAGYVDETFVLRPVGARTNILHRVDFSRAGLPWFLKVIMKVLNLVGRKESRSSLDCLRELAEESR